jgi:phosphatidylinositol-3-phosphatase
MPPFRTSSFAALVLVTAFGLFSASTFARHHGEPVSTSAAKVRHVFIIMLENKNFGDTFGTSTQDPYLQKTLVPMGGLLTEYYGTGHVSLDNCISLLSGQSPTPDTDNDCLPGFTGTIGNYNDVEESGIAPDGQIVAKGG